MWRWGERCEGEWGDEDLSVDGRRRFVDSVEGGGFAGQAWEGAQHRGALGNRDLHLSFQRRHF